MSNRRNKHGGDIPREVIFSEGDFDFPPEELFLEEEDWEFYTNEDPSEDAEEGTVEANHECPHCGFQGLYRQQEGILQPRWVYYEADGALHQCD